MNCPFTVPFTGVPKNNRNADALRCLIIKHNFKIKRKKRKTSLRLKFNLLMGIKNFHETVEYFLLSEALPKMGTTLLGKTALLLESKHFL